MTNLDKLKMKLEREPWEIARYSVRDCFNCPMLRDCCIEQDKLLEVNKDNISQICKSLLTKWLYMEYNERK